MLPCLSPGDSCLEGAFPSNPWGQQGHLLTNSRTLSA